MVKKLLIKSAILAIISITPLLAYNLILDPYMVLRKKYDSMYVCPNERFLKLDYLIRNPDKYDSYVFGSSRVSQIPVDYLSKMTGDRYYNMTYITGLPFEHLTFLKLMLKKKVKIKRIIVGLDILSFRSEYVYNSHIRWRHYPDSLCEKIIFYHDYLTLEPNSEILQEIKFDGKDVYYDLTNTGCYYFLKLEKRLMKYPAEHELRFFTPPIQDSDLMDKTLATIKEIIQLCEKEGISLTFFMHPLNQSWYLAEDINFMNMVMYKLSTMTEFWDFSGINSITLDNYNYYDISHYRPYVGKYILARMFNFDEPVPDDFGVLVTRDNVIEHLSEMKEKYYRYREESSSTNFSKFKDRWLWTNEYEDFFPLFSFENR